MTKGYMLLQLLIYLCLTCFLALAVTRFCGTFLRSFHKQAELTTGMIKFYTLRNLIDKILQEAPGAQSNWHIKNSQEILWYAPYKKCHESLRFKDKKVLHYRGTYDEQEKRWQHFTFKRVLGYGLEKCSWQLKSYKPFTTKETYIKTVITSLSIAKQKFLEGRFYTLIGEHGVKK